MFFLTSSFALFSKRFKFKSCARGSPPKIESPSICSNFNLSITKSSSFFVHSFPASFSQYSSLKQPSHLKGHPVTNIEVLMPGPFATSYFLIWPYLVYHHYSIFPITICTTLRSLFIFQNFLFIWRHFVYNNVVVFGF